MFNARQFFHPFYQCLEAMGFWEFLKRNFKILLTNYFTGFHSNYITITKMIYAISVRLYKTIIIIFCDKTLFNNT